MEWDTEAIVLTEIEKQELQQGLGLLHDHYAKIEKAAEKIGDWHIVASARAQKEALIALRDRVRVQSAPSDQIDAFVPDASHDEVEIEEGEAEFADDDDFPQQLAAPVNAEDDDLIAPEPDDTF